MATDSALPSTLITILEKSRVSSIMTSRVISLTGKDSVLDAMKLMAKHSFTSVIIAENEKPVGIITHTDLVNKIFLKNKDPKKTLLAEVMSAPVITVPATTPLLKASDIMKTRKVKKLLVVDGNSRMCGIVTQTDIIKNLNSLYLAYPGLLHNPWFLFAVLAFISFLFLLNYLFLVR